MRLAHFSDIHLLALDGARPRDFLGKRLLGGLNILLKRGRSHGIEVFDAMVLALNGLGVEELVCTGDVTNLALEPEFRLAKERFGRIDGASRRLTCLPGNHDRYVPAAVGLFERYLGEHCAPDAAFGDEPWPMVRVRGDVALIGVDSVFPTPWFFAHGACGSEQLAKLEALLSGDALAGKCRVVLIHHPPAGRAAGVKKRGLRDHREFAAVLERSGAELVLHGHEHQDLRETLPGPEGRPIVVRGIPSGSHTGTHEGRLASFRIYTVGSAGTGRPGIVEHETWVYRAEEGRFVASGPAVPGP